MFEEHLREMWICAKCGEVSKVRVVEHIRRIFERNSLGVFEFTGRIRSEMKVYCSECNSECYRW